MSTHQPSNPAKTALIIGITGSFGRAVAEELLRRDWTLRALVRSPESARQLFPDTPAIEWITGDALQRDDVRRAAEGTELIVDGFNVPYQDWDPIVVNSAQIVADVAAEMELTILFPGNVYAFGPDFSSPLAEDAPRTPPTPKGALRNKIEDIFLASTKEGAHVIILRCGDFFGPDLTGQNSWTWQIVHKAIDGKKIVYPGPLDVPHQWAYLPDVAHTAVDLVEARQHLQPFATFHFPGHFLPPQDLITAIRTELDDPNRKVKNFPWTLLGLLRPFSPMIRELLPMRYLWDVPLQLDGRHLSETLDDVPHTPLQKAIHHTINGLRQNR